MREMKDSGIEWINQIPKSWELKRIKAVLHERNETNNPIKTNFILSLTNDRGIIPYEEKGDVGNKSKDDITGYKLAYPDDIVLNSMNVFIGSVALSKYYGCVSPVYYMLRLRNRNDDIRFYNYLFQTRQLQTKLHGYGNGIMDIRMRIQMSKLNTVMLPIPPFEEQRKIADYLDDKCSKIDAIIEKQGKIIEKLKEYKLSVIQKIITKGVNKDIQFKNSGIKWIGWIPEHWNIAKLKYVADLINGDRSSKYPSGEDIVKEGVMFITSNNLGQIKINNNIDSNKFITKEKYEELGGAKVQLNDIIFCLRGSVGKCSINKDLREGAIASSLVDIRAKQVSPDYLNYILQNPGFTDVATVNAIGIGSLNLAAKDVGEVKIPVPPIEESESIANLLDSKITIIEEVISRYTILVERLQSYKKSLIYECVTGKKEVC